MTWFANTILRLIREDWRPCLIYLVLSVVINLDSDLSAIAPRTWFWFTIFYVYTLFFAYYLGFIFQRTMLKWHGFYLSNYRNYGLGRYLLRNIGLDCLVIACILTFGIMWLVISPETMNAAMAGGNKQTILMSMVPLIALLIVFLTTRFGNWITLTLIPYPPIVSFQWDRKSLLVFLSLLLLFIVSGLAAAFIRWALPIADPSMFWFYEMPAVTILGLLVQTIISILAFAGASIIITKAFIDRVGKLSGAPSKPQT